MVHRILPTRVDSHHASQTSATVSIDVNVFFKDYGVECAGLLWDRDLDTRSHLYQDLSTGYPVFFKVWLINE